MNYRPSGAMLSTLVVAAFVLTTVNVLRTRNEEKAITTIIRSGGRVYYGFQDPQLSVRKRSNSAIALASTGAVRIRGYADTATKTKQAAFADAIAPASFMVNDRWVADQATALELSSNIEPSGTTQPVVDEQELYFEVLPKKNCRVHMAERIMTDLLRRIECATISGPRLDEEVLASLADLKRLRQLIVYDSNPKQRTQLAKQLPDVEIIWR